jgi:hypothetical protein
MRQRTAIRTGLSPIPLPHRYGVQRARVYFRSGAGCTPSSEGRSLERAIAAVAHSCRKGSSISCKTVQQAREKLTSIKQGTLLTEAHSMDEERRSLAELNILKGRARR